MAGGTNGPPVLNGAAFSYPYKTLAQLRADLTKRLGFSAMLSNPPPGLNILLDSFLQDAHEQLYERYEMLRTPRWWPIAVTTGNRFYDVPYEGAYSGERTDLAFVDSGPDTITRLTGSFVTDGFVAGQTVRITGSALNDGLVTVDTVAALTLTLSASDALAVEAAGLPIVLSQLEWVNLDFRQIEQAWIQHGTQWSRLTQGINAAEFGIPNQQIPTHFDLREYVELWPEPNQAYTVYLYGHLGLRAFTADTDKTTIDDKPVFLMALANAKAHYGQPDAGTYYSQLEVHMGRLNAGTYGTQRFVPCETFEAGGPAAYPQVTGTAWDR